MGRAGPSAQTNNFQRNRAIKTFLASAINHALSASANHLEQLVSAELHLDTARLLLTVVVLLERSQSSSEQTNAAKAAWRIAKYCRAAFCAHVLNFVGLGTQSRSSL